MSCDVPEPADPHVEEIKLDLPDGIPPLRSLYLYMTNGCNLSCRHCWVNPIFEKGLPSLGQYIDIELLKKTVAVAKTIGLTTSKFTGGEPLLHPNFLEIADFMHAQKISITMETNGTLITEEIATHMKEKTSIWHISISLDSPRSQYHDYFRGVEGAFDKAVQGIKHVVAAGYKPQIIMCLSHGNAHEIEDLVKLAIDLGAGSVKFNPVKGAGRGKSLLEKGDGFTFEETLEIVRHINRELQPNTPIPLISLLPPTLLSIGELIRHGKHGGACSIMNVLGLLGSGEMALCGIGQTVPEFCFGNIGKDNLKEVWINNPKLNELRNAFARRLPGVCGDCIHSPRCLMNCVAINYVENGNLISPDSRCIEAEKRGLFPNTRRRLSSIYS